jgi:nucleoside permease NupC
MTAAANIFVGMSEAPLMIMPLIPQMTTSELHAVLTGGFATMAGFGNEFDFVCFSIRLS